MNVASKHIVKLQGKDFITYDGLLDMAHQMGLVSIKTELVSSDPYIFKATARTEAQEFDGYGDADDGNVNKMIAKHKIRMAETRAKARALRDLTNVGMCSVEEMGGDEKVTSKDAGDVFDPAPDINFNDDDPSDGNVCLECSAEMTAGQIKVSSKKYGKLLCPKCQQKEVA